MGILSSHQFWSEVLLASTGSVAWQQCIVTQEVGWVSAVSMLMMYRTARSEPIQLELMMVSTKRGLPRKKEKQMFICSTGLDGGRFAEYLQKLCRKWEVPCPEVVILSAFILGSSEPEETEQFHFRSAAAATQLNINNNFCLFCGSVDPWQDKLAPPWMHPFFLHHCLCSWYERGRASKQSPDPPTHPPTATLWRQLWRLLT